jgi:hypothetical protein
MVAATLPSPTSQVACRNGGRPASDGQTGSGTPKPRRRVMRIGPLLVFLVGIVLARPVFAEECVACHTTVTPNIVADWQVSRSCS